MKIEYFTVLFSSLSYISINLEQSFLRFQTFIINFITKFFSILQKVLTTLYTTIPSWKI